MGKRKRRLRKAIRNATRELVSFALGAVAEFVTERFGKNSHGKAKRPPQLRSENA